MKKRIKLSFGFAILAMLAMSGCSTLPGLKDDGMAGLAVYCTKLPTQADPDPRCLTPENYQTVVKAMAEMKLRIVGQITSAGRVALEKGIINGVLGGAVADYGYGHFIPKATAAIARGIGIYTGGVYFAISAYGGVQEASCTNVQVFATAVERALRDAERLESDVSLRYVHVAGVCIGTDNTSAEPGKALQAQMPEFSGRPAETPVR